MVKKRLRPGTDVGYVSDEVRRVSECPIYGDHGRVTASDNFFTV